MCIRDSYITEYLVKKGLSRDNREQDVGDLHIYPTDYFAAKEMCIRDRVTSPTETGKLLYKFADQFYVQWESMLSIYPKAIYLGGIY